MPIKLQPISFFVPGIPRPAGSKRAFAIKKGGAYTGRCAVMDDSGKAGSDWRGDVKRFATDAYHGTPLDCPLSVTFLFLFPRPKSHYRTGRNANQLKPAAPTYHAGKPDVTKLIRSVEDALTSICWRDDAVIVEQKSLKRYCDGDEKSGVWVIVEPKDYPADEGDPT